MKKLKSVRGEKGMIEEYFGLIPVMISAIDVCMLAANVRESGIDVCMLAANAK